MRMKQWECYLFLIINAQNVQNYYGMFPVLVLWYRMSSLTVATAPECPEIETCFLPGCRKTHGLSIGRVLVLCEAMPAALHAARQLPMLVLRLLRESVPGNDIEAWLAEDYLVVKCVRREIWSVCTKCFWLSAKVPAQILGEGSALPFLFSWGSEWMSLLASLVIPLSIKLIFPFSESCLSRITTRLDCRGILMSWHLMSSHCHGLNERNWEGGRRRQQERHQCMHGVSCVSSKSSSFTHHWRSL